MNVASYTNRRLATPWVAGVAILPLPVAPLLFMINISHGFPFCIIIIRSCPLPAPTKPDLWGATQVSGVGGFAAHAVRMNSAATTVTAFLCARRLFAFIAGPCGKRRTNAGRLAAAFPAETFTRNRKSFASSELGSTLTARANGGTPWLAVRTLPRKLSHERNLLLQRCDTAMLTLLDNMTETTLPRKPSLSRHLRNARIGRGLTQVELARQVGVSTVSIYLWETGKTRPQAQNLSALCKALKLPVRTTKAMAAG